jgi:hypothetical protein
MRDRDELAANRCVEIPVPPAVNGDGQFKVDNQMNHAIPKPIRRKAVRQAKGKPKSTVSLPDANVSVGHTSGETHVEPANSGSGHMGVDYHSRRAAPDQFAGQRSLGNRSTSASVGMDLAVDDIPISRVHPQIIAAIQSLHREHRAIQRQMGDMERRIKAEARWFAVRRYRAEGIPLPAGKFPDVTKADEQMVIATRARFFAIRDYTEQQRKECQKELLKLVKPLPIMAWAGAVKGLGLPSVAAIIGEAGDLANYSNPGKLWKRMGLAVIDGKSQGKRTNAEEALRHGYSPARRSEMHVIGDCLVRAGGPYADLYRARKAVEMEREGITKMHAHKRALRYIEKRLLREMWSAWRGASAVLHPLMEVPPADELAGPIVCEDQMGIASRGGDQSRAEIHTASVSVQLSRVKRVRRTQPLKKPSDELSGANMEGR